MQRERDKIIAIDFDGTIYDSAKKQLVEGTENGIKALYQKGYILVLWTCRSGRRLTNAINILKRYGLYQYFYCVNETPDFVKYKISCKVCANIYIDDRNIGGFIGWDKVLEILR